MELLCAELVIKRKELLGMSKEIKNVDDDLNEIQPSSSSQLDDAIINCKIAEVVFKNSIKQITGLKIINVKFFFYNLKKFFFIDNLPQLVQSFILIATK